MITAMVVASPMAIFIGLCGGIAAWPPIKRGVYLAYDNLTKGRNNPDTDIYALIAGSMVTNTDEWSFSRGEASWPKREIGKSHYVVFIDEHDKDKVKLRIDGGTRDIDGYWAKVFRTQIQENAAREESKRLYNKLFPNGSEPLLIGFIHD